jgi:hypothetical protein
MENERRLFVRFLMSGSVIVQFDRDSLITIDCELVDLGFEGVGFYSPKPIIVEKVKFIIINRQLNVNISGTGKIIFCKAVKYNNEDYYRVGLEFIEVDRDQVRAILMQVREIPRE